MTAKFMLKCRLFATDIKKQSRSIFSDAIQFQLFEHLNKTYSRVLECKRNAIDQGFNDPYYHFTAKNEASNDIENYVLRPSHALTDDQILKIIISVEMFYLSHQAIKKSI